jgi:hypothetical protein
MAASLFRDAAIHQEVCWIAESFQASEPDPDGRQKVQTSVASVG